MKPRLESSSLFTSRLNYFVRAVAYPTLTEAATHLGLTQAALSQAIIQLEAEVGEPLLARSRRGIALTDKGRQFLEIVTSHQRRMAVDLATAWHTEDRVRVSIGSVMHFGIYTLRPLIDRLGKALPPLQLGVTWSLDSMQAVKDGRIDFAFVAWTTRPRGVEWVAIQPDPSAIVGLRTRYRELARARSMAEIEHLPWIAQPKPQHDWTQALAPDRAGFVVRDMFAFRELILCGAGIADAQLDFFTPAERARLTIARHLPSRYQDERIYAVHRGDLRPRARECLDRLLVALRARPVRRTRTVARE